MDEPLSNLDAQLRVATRAEIASLQQRLGITTLYVTHDQVEAMTMGDRVAVMKDGLLQQCDTPRALYDQPENAFVAGFLGSPPMNLVEASVTTSGVDVGSVTLPVPTDLPVRPGTPVTVGLRPEAIELSGPGSGIPATVIMVEQLGAEAFVYVAIDPGQVNSDALQPKRAIVRVEPTAAPLKGERVQLHPRAGAMLFFDSETGMRLRTSAPIPVEPQP
jgi:multiple sugar transport system ATP-binding protein